MIRTPVAGLRGQIGETVTIAGWAQALRLQRAMQFIIVRDHTGTVQVTHRRDGSALERALDALTTESAVRITGRVQANPVVSLGGLELVPETVTVESLAETPLPTDGHTGPEGRLDWRFLDVRRRPAARLVFEVQTTVERAMREFAYAEDCTEMHTPKLMGTASESGAEVFELGYFGRPAYLAQIAGGIDRVFEVGPCSAPSRRSPHGTHRVHRRGRRARLDRLRRGRDELRGTDARERPRVGGRRARRGDRGALQGRGDGTAGPVPAAYRPAEAAAPAVMTPATATPLLGAPTVTMPVIAPAGPVPVTGAPTVPAPQRQ